MSGIKKVIADFPEPLYTQFRDVLDSRNETAAYVLKNLVRSWLAEVEGEPKPTCFRRAAVKSKKLTKPARYEVVKQRSDGRRYSDGDA